MPRARPRRPQLVGAGRPRCASRRPHRPDLAERPKVGTSWLLARWSTRQARGPGILLGLLLDSLGRGKDRAGGCIVYVDNVSATLQPPLGHPSPSPQPHIGQTSARPRLDLRTPTPAGQPLSPHVADTPLAAHGPTSTPPLPRAWRARPGLWPSQRPISASTGPHHPLRPALTGH